MSASPRGSPAARADAPAALAVAFCAAATVALLASPVAGGATNADKAACLAKVTCAMPAVWDEWGQKFNASIFQAADGGWSQALELYLNPAKTEHWLDEYHIQAGCCEHWRCNNVTLRCEPPVDSAAPSLAAGTALAAALAASAALLL